MNIENNIPAFARSRSVNHSDEQDGMTLLDYFAAKIAAALAPHYGVDMLVENPSARVCAPAYKVAAAMLEERSRVMQNQHAKPYFVVALAEHIISMADDEYLSGHPEWNAIVQEARQLI